MQAHPASVEIPRHPSYDRSSGDSSMEERGSTYCLARWISGIKPDEISESARQWAQHTLLDWMAVAVAGWSEPLVRILASEYGGQHANAFPLLSAQDNGAPMAALINGAAGHALDFDDVAERMRGHPSVPVVPAVLALAQLRSSSGRDVLDAIVVGHEVESCIGDALGMEHSDRGFHPTGTLGTFGAAAACARLMKLDTEACAHALGLAAAQAAGLKSMFGTMAKPFHAGKAAMNGLMAAQLAAKGFTAHLNGIETHQGFAHTQASLTTPLKPVDTTRGFAIEKTLFKFHASCYLTHATIEAVRCLRKEHRLALEDFEDISIHAHGAYRNVCDILAPQTGLELKFSIRQLALMALDGADTASLGLYTDETALAPRYANRRSRVQFMPTLSLNRYTSKVVLSTRDGRTLSKEADVGAPSQDLPEQWKRLINKAQAIATPVIGDQRFACLLAHVENLAYAGSVQPLMETLR